MLEEEIKKAIKKKNVIIGFKKSLKYMKINKPKLVVIAKNIQEDRKKEIEYLAKIGKFKVKIFDGTSKELGIVCGKPFPISTLVIKK